MLLSPSLSDTPQDGNGSYVPSSKKWESSRTEDSPWMTSWGKQLFHYCTQRERTFMLCDQFSLYLKPFPFLVSRISLGRQSQIWENHGIITIHSFILMANIESTFPRNKLSPKTFQSLMQFSVAPIKQSDVTGVWVLNKNPRYNFRVE